MERGLLEDGYRPEMQRVHERNTLGLKVIVNNHGWPGKSLVDEVCEQVVRITTRSTSRRCPTGALFCVSIGKGRVNMTATQTKDTPGLSPWSKNTNCKTTDPLHKAGRRGARRRNWPHATTFACLVLAVGPFFRAAAEPSVLSDAQKEDFLRTANVVERRAIGVGVNETERITLQASGTQHDTHWQTVNISKNEYPTASGTELFFRDRYQYNVAAYKLDRLIGLNMVPVSVKRKINGKTGSLTWWVDDVLMMERERYDRKTPVPADKKGRWLHQVFHVRIFNELVYNTDANLGNLLITKDWDLRIIDFTRAFRMHKDLRAVKNLGRCDPRILKGLRELDFGTLQTEMKGFLSKTEVKALLARRDKIVAFFDREIAKKGKAAVLCGKHQL